MFRDALNEAASLLGIRHGRRLSPPAATLLPISPELLERPADWPASVHLTGPWVDSETPAELQQDVAEFMAGGPFVYAGFGSMASGDPVVRGRALIDAARVRGHRVLIATGLGGIDVGPELRGNDLLAARSVPHDLVLPHTAAAVHHCGIGTVHAAMRAGAPSVIIPFIADQPFWGAMLHRHGLAPAAIPHRRVTAARIGSALDAAPQYREPVGRVSERMRAERGTAVALDAISGIG